MPGSAWVPDVLSPDIYAAGVKSTPKRASLDFQGFNVTDDPATGRKIITPQELKGMVHAATTAALPANTRTGNTLQANANGALAAQDIIPPFVGMRLLVKDEASQLKNGIYKITQVGSVSLPWIMVREPDADDSFDFTSSSVWLVKAGAANGGKKFTSLVSGSFVLNTDAIVFTANTNVIRDTTITVAPVTATIEYHNCLISVNINVATRAKFRGCLFSPGVTVTAPTIDVDNDSLRSMVTGGGAITGTVTGYAGQCFEWGALTASNGQFLIPGVRASNATSSGSEDASKKTVPRAGVWINFLAFASSAVTLVFRKNAANTGFGLAPSNSIVTDMTTRVLVAPGDSVGWGVTGSSTNVLVVAEFV